MHSVLNTPQKLMLMFLEEAIKTSETGMLQQIKMMTNFQDEVLEMMARFQSHLTATQADFIMLFFHPKS